MDNSFIPRDPAGGHVPTAGPDPDAEKYYTSYHVTVSIERRRTSDAKWPTFPPRVEEVVEEPQTVTRHQTKDGALSVVRTLLDEYGQNVLQP